jgi:hypothetical protein
MKIKKIIHFSIDMEGKKKRGRPQKPSCDSSESSIPLALRRLDVGQRNQTLFSERTHSL